MWNRETTNLKRSIRQKRRERFSQVKHRSNRRGVLLLVVLSMLVLFMLIGTAFLMSSSQQSKNASNAAKLNSVGNPPTKDLDSALMQVLRDSDNEHSAIRYHSLLRDIYGTDGFQGVVYSPLAKLSFDPTVPAQQVTRFAAATAGTAAQQLGPTAGQFIDIYVRALGWDIPNNKSVNDPLTTSEDESATLVQPDSRHIIRLEKNFFGRPQLYTLPLTKGYFNGCLLTITSGPAAGQSTRILDYEYVGDTQQPSGTVATRLFRFRVMAFPRADGQPLQILSRPPEIADLAGATFLVNGRAFSGTGVGYNPFATIGQPRLNAQETVLMGSDLTKALYPEVALTPNAAYFFPCDPDTNPNLSSHPDARGVRIPGIPGVPNSGGQPMNPKITTAMSAAQIATALSQWRYPSFAGPGDVNESYDAPDFQNMPLALQTLTPRSQGRVVQGTSASNVTLSATDPSLDRTKFLRLDLEDVTIPSFYRPDLMNYWFHRLLFTLTDSIGPFGMKPDEAVAAILDPYPNGTLRSGLSSDVAALITAIKRKVSLRPLREDNPHFDGGNPLSVVQNLQNTDLTVGAAPNLNIAIPYWEAVGPWDVDNDNDGVPDSIWVDVGNPVQVAADGTRYKALVSYLIVDLDSRLNVNAHGLADEIVPPTLDSIKKSTFDLTTNMNPTPGNLAHVFVAGAISSTLQLPRGLGYGPAEISLRPLFPAPLDAAGNPRFGNRDESVGPVDNYAALLSGRRLIDGNAIDGKYGNDPNLGYPVLPTGDVATAGANYRYQRIVTTGAGAEPLGSPRWFTGEQATPSLLAQLKFFDYPWSLSFVQPNLNQSAFGTMPDLRARYALGLDYMGQPVYEVANDVNPNTATLGNPNLATFPNNQRLPFDLLAKSPYELDLSSVQRRDEWLTGANALLSDTSAAFNQSLVQNDDAPFSSTDLEKVLRAWDADAGTLPSRLWDCVSAFDPLKLYDPNKPLNQQSGDPYRVEKLSQQVFGSTATSEMLATAQQVAGINRRLVTTDSYDLPVVSGNFAERLAFGADGKPGKPGVDDDGYQKDDDGDGFIDEPDEVDNSVAESQMYAPLSFDWKNPVDDYHVIMGTNPPAKATIIDYLRYRIVLELRKQQLIAPNLPPTDPAVEARVNAIIQQLLAPEVIAGKRMDLNRPFGDGRDNNGDGVVDDPLEAGEPFLDANGNGKRDPNERFLDLNGNKQYDGPGDVLWQGLTSEQISFDYTNGVNQPIYKSALSGGVRNLESQGRQVFARQLYCLMLLLVDENYIAPWDDKDPQITTWIIKTRDDIKKALEAAPYNLTTTSAAQADLIVKRKLTCRTIAQWAINCVDMRDADVIMTPFEYDENPWDGWGVPDKNGVNIPLDGDPATDENKGELIDWTAVPANDVGGPKQLTTITANDLPAVLNQTRGLVWGAERPELLITETLAFHDRRTEDLISADPDGHGEMKHYKTDKPPGTTGPGNYQDPDPDQGLRPRGSMFVEVNNPWSSAGQHPAELYSRVDSSHIANNTNLLVPSNGVELGRLSNYATDSNGNLTLADSNAANGIKRSPVWRLIAVEEWPDWRNADDVDEKRTDREVLGTEPKAYSDMAGKIKSWKPIPTEPTPPFRPTNPDFDGAFDADFVPRQKNIGQNFFQLQYPYVEREFYFTTDKSPAMTAAQLIKLKDQMPDYDYADSSFKLRIPHRMVDIKYPTANLNFKPGYIQRFIPAQLEANVANPIAPILPGRYGVIGSAGTKYSTTEQTYTSTIGRFDLGTSDWNTSDSLHKPVETRRIELHPDSDPNKQQVVVATNGGDPKDNIKPSLGGIGGKQFDPTTPEIGRDNELINDKGVVKNIYLDANGKPGSNYYEPSVAIPVEGMNISEPAWGWGPREFQAAQEGATAKGGGAPNYLQFKPDANNKYEGRYFGGAGGGANKTSYDKPLDGFASDGKQENIIAPELLRNGTTANYRTIHLQRLANPMLPWNPPPFLADGKTKNPDHRDNLPINPYRTVDTASVDLTAFNGTTSAEANYPVAANDAQNKLLQWRPWEMSEQTKYQEKYAQDKQVWHFRSSERGGWARLNVLGAAASPTVSPPQRVLWAQEPAMVKFKPATGYTDMFDLMTIRQMTMRAVEVDSGVTLPSGVGPVTKINHADMVMEHTLGFGNKSFGLLYDAQGSQGAKSQAPTSAAIGAPAPGDYTWHLDSSKDPANAPIKRIPVDSTNPWFAWNNRPYVSAEELMNVPAASQATMLRMYSTLDPASAIGNQPQAYGLARQNPDSPPTMGSKLYPAKPESRWRAGAATFGQLATMFSQSSTGVLGTATTEAADVVRDPTTGVPMLFPNNPIDPNASIRAYGAPNFYRILDYVQVPSRFVGTDTMLNAETFNDVPGVNDSVNTPGTAVGSDILSSNDPRYNFQPPFNKVSRERDPGRVNLNTVAGRRTVDSGGIPHHWSEVFDGIMHRSTIRDSNPTPHFIAGDGNILDSAGNVIQLGQPGPAWRDVVLSRRGYAQYNAGSTTPVEKSGTAPPDVYAFGVNPLYPTIFANPFRSADAGDLVPLAQMMQFGVDASLLRKHPYDRATNSNGARQPWGPSPMNFGDARDAGFGANESVSVRANNGAIPSDDPAQRDILPLFSEKRDTSYSDTDRNPYNMYQPMTRLGNLVTDRSNVYAVWITVGYFEVEPAPNWNDPDTNTKTAVRQRFGATNNDTDAETVAGLALYNRVYPEGYMLGRELGSDTGNVTRPRGFYIIDRSEPVGFKPGEDLNVEKAIRLRRRIE